MKSLFLALSTVCAATALVHADSAQNNQQAAPTPYIEYNNRMAVFTPWHVTYERTKVDAFYAGLEAWATPALFHHHNRIIAEGEFRLGYNYFWNGRDHFTPFAGIGYFKETNERWCWWQKHHHIHGSTKAGVLYGTIGVLYDHEFTDVFNLGFNVKGLVGGPVSHRHHHWGSPVFGIDVAVPFTFRFGYKKHWDVRIEPFDIYLHGSKHHENYFGGRSTIGYRF